MKCSPGGPIIPTAKVAPDSFTPDPWPFRNPRSPAASQLFTSSIYLFEHPNSMCSLPSPWLLISHRHVSPDLSLSYHVFFSCLSTGPQCPAFRKESLHDHTLPTSEPACSATSIPTPSFPDLCPASPPGQGSASQCPSVSSSLSRLYNNSALPTEQSCKNWASLWYTLAEAVRARKVTLCLPDPRVWLSTFPAGSHRLSFPSSP